MSEPFVAFECSNGGTVLLDERDVDLAAWSWARNRGGYAQRTDHRSGRTLRLHRVVFGRMVAALSPSIKCDHINGNPLDNRRANLRAATPRQNNANMRKLPGRSSRFKGVTWHKQVGKWQAAIQHAGRCLYLGLHATEVGAARAYNDRARLLFGEFARLNEVGDAIGGAP